MSIPLLSTILALLAWGALARDRDRTVAGAALLANLLLCWGLWRLTDNPADPNDGFDPLGLFAIDFTTAVLLAVATRSRPPLVISFIYAIQCVMHCAVCALGEVSNKHNYAVGLEVLAWAQAIYLGGWGGYLSYRRAFQSDNSSDDPEANRVSAATMACPSDRP